MTSAEWWDSVTLIMYMEDVTADPHNEEGSYYPADVYCKSSDHFRISAWAANFAAIAF